MEIKEVRGLNLYTFAAKSWSNSNTYVHVGVHEFPGASYQSPINQGREIKFINNSRGSDTDVPSEPKIGVKWSPSSESEAVSGEGVKELRITTPGEPRELEREKEGKDEREGAEQPVVDHDDREVFVSQLTEAGVRKGERDSSN